MKTDKPLRLASYSSGYSFSSAKDHLNHSSVNNYLVTTA